MDGLQFTSSIIGSLAWPLAVVVVALLFRQQVKALLSKVKLAKGAGMEFQFAEELRAVVAEAQAVTVPLPPIEPGSDLKLPPPPTVQAEVKTLLSVPPKMMILDAWEPIENMMRNILVAARAKLPEGDKRFRNSRLLIEGLFHYNLVNESEADILHSLYNLRNHVAHNSVEPSLNEALEYYKTSMKALDILGKATAKVKAALPGMVQPSSSHLTR